MRKFCHFQKEAWFTVQSIFGSLNQSCRGSQFLDSLMFSLTMTLPVKCVPLLTASGYGKFRLHATEELARGLPRKWLSNILDKMRSDPENLSLNVIAMQSSPKADLRETYFLTLLPSIVEAVGGTCRVAISSLQREGLAVSCSGLLPKRSGNNALAERWLH